MLEFASLIPTYAALERGQLARNLARSGNPIIHNHV